jgi:hypothetical protein
MVCPKHGTAMQPDHREAPYAVCHKCEGEALMGCAIAIGACAFLTIAAGLAVLWWRLTHG